MGGESSEKVVTLAAAGPDQMTGTEEAEAHGLFTYYLLRGLNGAARGESGQITVKSLYEYLTPHVQDSARRKNREQKPMLLGVLKQAESFVLR